MGTSYNPRIVTDGLVFCVDAADKRSYPGAGTTWTDLSKNRNNGTLVNSPTFDSANGGSIAFDGANDRVDLSTTLVSSTAYTVSCWFSCNDVAFAGALFGFGTNANNSQNIYLYGAAGFCSMPAGGGFGYNNWNCDCWGFSGANAILRGTGFHHLVATFNNANVLANKIWLDGEAKAMSNVGQNNANDSEPLSNNFRLGCNGWNLSTAFWNGNIASCAIYNRILSDTEVRQNYLATKGRFQ